MNIVFMIVNAILSVVYFKKLVEYSAGKYEPDRTQVTIYLLMLALLFLILATRYAAH